MEITKEQLIFSRGEGGNLIPQEVKLENIDGDFTVKLVPLTRGKLQEIHQMATSTDSQERLNADTVIMQSGLVSPKLTDEELADMKPQLAVAINQAILAISLGISQKEVGEKTDEVIQNQELMLKKK